MKIHWLEIEDWRNLQKFKVEFDGAEPVSVVIGQNGTGKSNFFEAIVRIFRYLDHGKKQPPFNFKIKYSCAGHEIGAWGQYYNDKLLDGVKLPLRASAVYVDGKEVTFTKFLDNREQYLPRQIFAYYSGRDRRLEQLFDDHAAEFYELSLGTKKPKAGQEHVLQRLRRLFYCKLIHSQFVLLSFYAEDDPSSREFLSKYLGIEDLDSMLFVLRRPFWFKSKPNTFQKENGDPRFWYAAGVVRDFLEKLWDASLAPIRHKERTTIDFRGRSEAMEFLYLFLKDKKKLQELANQVSKEPTEFFRDLESTYINDLIEEVRVTVKRVDGEGRVTFSELSEGEKQLITVLGLMKFTKDEECLYLLDEPDTHLNPVWKYDYLSEIDRVVSTGSSSQLVLCTHDPLVIGGLRKNQVRVFADPIETEEGKANRPFEPEDDPRGMGVTGLLRSPLFGLKSTVDRETYEKLDARFILYGKGDDRTEDEEVRFQSLNDELAKLGFTRDFRDPLYQKFAEALSKREEFLKPNLNEEDQRKRDEIIEEVLDEILEEKA